MTINPITILFFGSTTDSVLVSEKLHQYSSQGCTFQIIGIVTQPAKPVGRSQILTKTPTQEFAESQNIPVLTFSSMPDKPWLFADENSVLAATEPLKPELIISACFGIKIPYEIIQRAQFGGLNVHPSLLPRWRGADPVPWAIVAGDHQIGVTVVSLEEQFDAGKIIAQKKIPMHAVNSPDELRFHLFSLGADLLCEVLPDYVSGTKPGKLQDPNHATYAGRMEREDGFIPWDVLVSLCQPELGSESKLIDPGSESGVTKQTLKPRKRGWPASSADGQAQDDDINTPSNTIPLLTKLNKFLKTNSENQIKPDAHIIARAVTALSPWPGVWTKIRLADGDVEKRLKILAVHCENDLLHLDTVQLEGKKPVSFAQFSEAYHIEMSPS